MVELSKLIDECDKKKIYNFPMSLNGESRAMTDKKPARVSISLPEEICGKTLNDLDKWAFIIVAIEQKEFDRAFEKLKKGLKNEM